MKDISLFIYLSVFQAPLLSEHGGSYRTGTAHLTLAECTKLFGPAHDKETIDGKVTTQWHFTTPRGRVTLRDYWWNAKNEQSIASCNSKPAMWLAAYIRRKGYGANLGTHRSFS